MSRSPQLRFTLLLGSIPGAVLCLGVALCLWWLADQRVKFDEPSKPPPNIIAAGIRLGEHLKYLSYDLAYLARTEVTPQDLLLVYLDENSYDSPLLKHTGETFDRAVYARLLDRLTQARARLVAFDLLFRDETDPASDDALASAMHRNGNVVIVSDMVTDSRPEVGAGTSKLPLAKLVQAGALYGVSHVLHDGNYLARQVLHGTAEEPGFAWQAAKLAKAPFALTNPVPDSSIWLNYYGGPSALRSMSLVEALDPQADLSVFKGRVVFVGRKPRIDYARRENDQFSTPYEYVPRHAESRVGGVYIVATAFLNLMRGDFLRQMSDAVELVLLVLGALCFGAGLVWLRPWWAVGTAAASAVILGALSCAAVWQTHVWWGWMFVSAVEIPVALAWALFTHTRRLGREKAILEATLTQTLMRVEEVVTERDAARSAAPLAPASAPMSAEAPTRPTPVVADHTLVRQVGRGGYGEVWLARNAIGTYHVVKLVFRQGFNDDGPYEREFRGIQKFMPISRSHPGFVHILHVGRNDRERFFYYVMETGDDVATGQEIDPVRYEPRTLGTVLREGGALPVRECVTLALALADALGSLHDQNLIHRDIKPANIIYLKGQPKLADIGLVTEIQSTHHDVSLLGTEGYIAPEGPGTPAADLYSLGKVLYEACMGLDRRRFPELPTALYDGADSAERMQLNRIILRACEPRPADRYATAAEMQADLRGLARDMGLTA
jgi:CHASE2 domain-containing sensor protein